MSEFDVVVRGGTVYDGTGTEPTTADVAVRHGLIAEVGHVAGSGRREIDAGGALVTPGFVDIHTHYDGQATWDSSMSSSSWHGVTTVVMGNCGVGFAPINDGDQQLLIELMEGVEDIPGTALHEGLSWDWSSFGEYLDVLDRRAYDLNVATQVPHAALRFFAMGHRAIEEVPATEEEARHIAHLAAEAITSGALGFTTSWTHSHKSSQGDYTPTLAAEEQELLAIARAIGATGQGVLQIGSEYTGDVDEEFRRMTALVRASGRPLSFLSGQNPVEPDRYLKILQGLTEAQEEGLPITAQVPPRGVGMLFGLDTTLNPFVMNPVYQEVQDRSVAQRAELFRDPAFRSRLLDAVTKEKDDLHTGGRLIYRYDRMFELSDPPVYEPDPSLSIASRARRERRRSEEVVLDILGQGNGTSLIYLFVLNYADGTLDAVRDMLVHPCTVPGLSDGGAHAGSICDASFPTTLLSWWGRDRPYGRISLPFLIHRQTQASAAAVGLLDRGVLAPGYRADLNVIDFDRLGNRRPEVVHDLPAGGRRIVQQAVGYLHSFVNGVETFADGDPTGALPGRLVRGSQPVPRRWGPKATSRERHE